MTICFSRRTQLATVEKDREELEETMQATKSILEETRAMQNQTEEDRRKIQVRTVQSTWTCVFQS